MGCYVLGLFGAFWAVLDLLGSISWAVWGCFGLFCIVLGRVGLFCVVLGFSGPFWSEGQKRSLMVMVMVLMVLMLMAAAMIFCRFHAGPAAASGKRTQSARCRAPSASFSCLDMSLGTGLPLASHSASCRCGTSCLVIPTWMAHRGCKWHEAAFRRPSEYLQISPTVSLKECGGRLHLT